ncbi:MAG: hypothetical protein KBT31_03140, partial [Firmicutes bacterium]|nr:hypothetical protein [Candidatus Colimorpha enterica]
SSVPVRVVVSNYIIDDGYELDLDNIITDYTSVKVTGPENIVSKISEARLEAQIGHVNKKVIYSGAFVLVDENGKTVNTKSLTTDISTVTATLPVYKYRDVPVEVTFKNGIFSQDNCGVTAFPATVRIKGDPDAVDGERIVIEIDEKTVADRTATVSYPISLSDGVINVDGINDISVTTDPFGISSKSISVNLNVKNPDLLDYSGIPSSITVKIRGDENFISTIENYNIYATVDLKGCSAGTNTLPVSLKFLSQYSGKIFEVGEYTVTATVN